MTDLSIIEVLVPREPAIIEVLVEGPPGQGFGRATEATLASAATVDLGAQTNARIHVTLGTGDEISSFGAHPNLVRLIRFDEGVTLVHDDDTLALPGGDDIVTEDGDSAIAMSDAVGNWTLSNYAKRAVPLDLAQLQSVNSWSQNKVGVRFRRDDDGADIAARFAAAAAEAQGGTMIVPKCDKPCTVSVNTLAGVAEIRGEGQDSRLDCSTRTAQGTLFAAQGELIGDPIPLTGDVDPSSASIPIASIAGIAPGQKVLIGSNKLDFANSEQHAGHWVVVDAIDGSSIINRDKLRDTFLVDDQAYIQLVDVGRAPETHGLSIVGTGWQYTANGTVNGDIGLEFKLCDSPKVYDIWFDDCGYNALRIDNCYEAEWENINPTFQKAQSTRQRSYGVSIVGAIMRMLGKSLKQVRGRHGTATVAGLGKAYDLIIAECNVRDAYAAAHANHDSAENVEYIANLIQGPGNGFDLRSPKQTLIGNRHINGYIATAGMHIVLRNNVGLVVIADDYVENIRYILRLQNDNDEPWHRYLGDDCAPGLVIIDNMLAVGFTFGIRYIHTGRPNAVAPGYNTTKGEGLILRNSTLIARPPIGGTGVSAKPILAIGYLKQLIAENNTILFQDTAPDYAITAQGVDKVTVNGGDIGTNSKGVLLGQCAAFDANGNPVTLKTQEIAKIKAPAGLPVDGYQMFNAPDLPDLKWTAEDNGWGTPIATWDFSTPVTEVDFTDPALSKYEFVRIEVEGIKHGDGAASHALAVQFTKTAGAGWTTGGYNEYGAIGSDAFWLTGSVDNTVTLGSIVEIEHFNSPTRNVLIRSQSGQLGSTALAAPRICYIAAGPYNGLRFFFETTSPNIVAGKIRVYGRN